VQALGPCRTRRSGVPLASWNVNDQRIPQGRLALVSYLSVGFIVLLMIGFWKLQVVQSEHFSDLAERNQIRSIPIIARRGAMLDRFGRVVVDSYPSFSILLLRDDPKSLAKSLPQIEEGLGIDHADLQQELEAAKTAPKFQPVIIKPAATQADIAFVESHRADLPLLELMMVERRRYPGDQLLANAIGYVGEVSQQQMDDSDGHYRPGDIVGKAGLEREYNDQLEGTDGMRRVIVNSVGKVIRTLDNLDAVPGKPIQLTIDLDLQQIAETDMAGKQGAVVAMDAHTGEVLAMVSRPTFDPNDFAVRIPKEEWQKLNTDKQTPLLNRVIQAQLAPGSVFKIVMSAAMVDSKMIPESYSVYCPGHANFYGREFHCWRPAGHGQVDLHEALTHSCDIFFYNVGKQLGIDKIAYYGSGFGLGKRTGIDLPSEETGLMPSEEWMERAFHRKWYAGETISVAIGQGAVTVTPIQLARMAAAVASGGTLVQPHMLKGKEPKIERFPISDEAVDKTTDGLYGVVNEAGGTAYHLRLANIDLSGKSGTAQLMSYDAANRLGTKKMDGWFVGFAPRKNPDIVVAAIVQDTMEHGGEAAGPVVRDIVKAFYDKKAGNTQQQTQNVPTTPPSAANVGPAAQNSSTQPADKQALVAKAGGPRR
jgi:penicillin-binding protein 2